MASFSEMNMSSNKKEKKEQKKLESKSKKVPPYRQEKDVCFDDIYIYQKYERYLYASHQIKKKEKKRVSRFAFAFASAFISDNEQRKRSLLPTASKHVQKWGGHNLLHRDSFRCTVRFSPPLAHLFFALLLLINDVVFPLDH